MTALMILNYGTVLLFGIVLSLSFSDVKYHDNKKIYLIILFGFSIAQAISYYVFDKEVLFKLYPFYIHLPLFLIIIFCLKKSILTAAVSVLSAYLFCTPRRWIGTIVACFFDNSRTVSYIAQIIVTIPMMIIAVKFISPFAIRLKYEDNKVRVLVISVPVIYYILEYVLTVYTKILYNRGKVIIEFMDAAVVIVYFLFSMIYLKTLYEKKEIEIENATLESVISQSKSEIELLRKADEQTAIYRHDLRHHLNYINACICDENLDEAKKYINKTCCEIEKIKVLRYSENESINLILSSYADRSRRENIDCDIKVSTSDFNRIAELDLCSLISNAAENAVHACKKIEDAEKRFFKLHLYEKNGKLCIYIKNSSFAPLMFINGIPATTEKNHGLGTKSMVYIVEKYKGIYKFLSQDGEFSFQAII